MPEISYVIKIDTSTPHFSFTQDLSDRTEKEKAETCEVVQRLETGSDLIIKNDWKKHITEELQEGK